MPNYRPPLNQTIRFLSVTWDARWEFDRPVLLLEPVQRYSFTSTDEIIEDAIVDLLTADDDGEGIAKNFDPGSIREFKWRRWNPRTLHKKALAGLEQGVDQTYYNEHLHIEVVYAKFFQDEHGELQVETKLRPSLLLPGTTS